MLYHATPREVKAWLANGVEPPPRWKPPDRGSTLFFDPTKLACGIVTCGGLCPGLNDVIRSIVLSLHHHYGVSKVYGFRFGYEGLVRRCGHEPLELTPEAVNRIHEIGGSILGSSRGPQDPAEMVQTAQGFARWDPVRHRRRRDASRRTGDWRGSDTARPADQRDRHPEDHRQRRLIRAENFWIRNCGHRSEASDLCGQHRSGGRTQRHRPGEADGPRLRVHRGLFRPGQQPCELLSRS